MGAGAESAPDSPACARRGTGRGGASQESTRGGPPTPTEPRPLHERSPSQKKDARKLERSREQPEMRPTTRLYSDFGIGVMRCRPVWTATGAIMMFTPDHVTKYSSPTPDEPRVVGAGRDRRSRRRRGRERSAPAPISRGRSGQHPAFEGTGSRRDAATRSPARPCSRCRHRPFLGAVACRDTIPSVATRASHRL